MLYKFKIPTNAWVTPYCETMTDSYYHSINNLGVKGVEELVWPGKPDFVPLADAFILRYHAHRVDFLTAARLNYLSGWLISEKMLDILLGFKLPEHGIYDAWVVHRKKRYLYKILHLYHSYDNVVDFGKSSFYVVDYLDKTNERVYIKDEKEYHLALSKLSQHNHMAAHKLYFIEESLIDVDIFKMQFIGSGIFFKKNIVDALKANSITGIDFEPVTQPLTRNIRWADTGLPVAD
ncbi:hypothetical protein C7N43_33150 [Sphingobacteriales bacterium UPWRP_1]|nr:hypothetical protein BVG80_01105 [Sphingobacteriales bacterium TSM_CSM]PSJ72639.1 hypothetical protein C7N43_33150 [Sphingobacteriales bacterium UPWRP_1]